MVPGPSPNTGIFIFVVTFGTSQPRKPQVNLGDLGCEGSLQLHLSKRKMAMRCNLGACLLGLDGR